MTGKNEEREQSQKEDSWFNFSSVDLRLSCQMAFRTSKVDSHWIADVTHVTFLTRGFQTASGCEQIGLWAWEAEEEPALLQMRV